MNFYWMALSPCQGTRQHYDGCAGLVGEGRFLLGTPQLSVSNTAKDGIIIASGQTAATSNIITMVVLCVLVNSRHQTTS